jgi:hypothetical protein
LLGAADDKFDLFLWETFTTKPFFDKRELYKMGEVETPWPAFVFASKIFAKTSHEQQISAAIKNQLFPALFETAQIFKSSSSHKGSVDRIMKEFHHTKEDAEMWLSRVRYGVITPVTATVKLIFFSY